MKKEITNIFIKSSDAERNENNNLLYSVKFDVPPIVIKNKANLKVGNICHTGSGHGDNIILFNIEGVMTDNNKYIGNHGGNPTIIATTFNNTRNLYEENDIPLIRQTINSIKINLSTLNSGFYYYNNNCNFNILRNTGALYYPNNILEFADNTGNKLLAKVTTTGGLAANASIISRLQILSSNSFYTSIPKFNNIVYGSNAVLTPVLTSNAALGDGTSNISSLTITNGGVGYAGGSTGHIIEFSGGGGSNAIACTSTVSAGGTINGVIVSSGGSGYTSVPSVNIKPRYVSDTLTADAIIPPMTSNVGVITEGIPNTLNFCISLKIEEEVNE